MSVIEALLETAYADQELIITRQAWGDDLQTPREVNFRFSATSKEMAETLISLVEDNQYGKTRLEPVGRNYAVIVTIDIPITEQVIRPVSGLMACLSKIFAVEYDGWDCRPAN
jgi:hypothetical protein